MDARICNFIKKADLRPCEVLTDPAPDGAHTCCGTHTPLKARLPPHTAGGCEFVIGGPADGHWCPRIIAPGDRLCPSHVLRRERENRLRIARNAAEAEARRALLALDVEMAGLRIAPPPPVPMLRARLDAALARADAAAGHQR